MHLPSYSDKARSLKPRIYEHYKGKRYRLLNIARLSETLEELAVYQQLYRTGDVWVRPPAMFTETVEGGVPRFSLIE